MNNIDKGVNLETESGIYFYTPKFYALDNFSAFIVELWGKKFQTCEHAFQWRKFSVSSPSVAEAILKANNPHEVKEISDFHRLERDSQWEEIKVQIMKEILEAKLSQHIKVQKVLRETGNKEIIKNSPMDDFWGNGPNGDGQNILGKIWMELRGTLPIVAN